MRYCRFKLGTKVHHGLIETVDGREMISVMLGVPPHDTDPIGTVIPDFIPPDRVPLSEANLLAPVHPHKIICVGRNYTQHAQELGPRRCWRMKARSFGRRSRSASTTKASW